MPSSPLSDPNLTWQVKQNDVPVHFENGWASPDESYRASKSCCRWCFSPENEQAQGYKEVLHLEQTAFGDRLRGNRLLLIY